MLSKRIRVTVASLLVLACLFLISACSSQTGQRAGQSAAVGAVSGAAGGVVSALIFGGDVGEAAARGAAWGGSMGAVGGAISGAQQDSAINGLVALTNCKHAEAASHAQAAKGLDNPKFALAGQWLEVLTLADQRQEDQARAQFPVLIEKDPEVGSEAQAEESMRKAMQGLMKIRAEHNLPQTCQ